MLETNHFTKLKTDNFENNENIKTDSILIEKKIFEYILKWHFQEYSKICSNSGCRQVIIEDNDNVVKILVFGTEEIVNNALEDFTNLIQKVDKEEIKEDSFELSCSLRNDAECLKCIQDSVLVKGITVNFVGTEEQKQDVIAKIKKIKKQSATNTSSSVHTASPTLTHPTIKKEVNLKAPSICAEKLLDSGLKVYIAKGNLVEQRTEAIVNPANNRLIFGGGAARAILEAAGSLLKKERDESISKFGELKVAEVRHTTAGKMGVNGVKYVLHVVGPKYDDYVDKNKMRDDLKMAFYNCLVYANTKCKIGSISIPAISSGIFGVNKKDVAVQMMLALDDYSISYSNLSKEKQHLKDIYFINNDDQTVDIIHKEFDNYLSGRLKEFNNYLSGDLNNPTEKNSSKCIEKPNYNFFSLIPNKSVNQVLKAMVEEIKHLNRYQFIHNFDYYQKIFMNKREHFYITKDNVELFSAVVSNALKIKIILKNETENFCKIFIPINNSNEVITIIYTPVDSDKLSFVVILNSSNTYNTNDKSYKDFEIIKPIKSVIENQKLASSNQKSGIKASNISNLDNFTNKKNDFEMIKSDKVKDTNNIEKEECAICMDDILDPEDLPCRHRFCRDCLTQFKLKCAHACPACMVPFGGIFGNMPDGTFKHEVIKHLRLSGFEQVDTIKMSFNFPDGIQQQNHPNPGEPYKGTYREAYLPNNVDGKEIMWMIEKAFNNKVLFTIGQSYTTGQNNVVTFNDIPLKTSLTGQFGYPDSGYFNRVKSELASKGIRRPRRH